MSVNPSHQIELIHAGRLIPSFLHLRVRDRGFDSHPGQPSAMFLHAQCRSFFCLLMLSADVYIDVRERLQVNDLFMRILVDICANNCKSRSDFLVTSRLWRSMSGWYFDSYNNSVNAIRHSLIALISTHVCHHHYTFPPCALNKCSSHTLLHVSRSDVL